MGYRKIPNLYKNQDILMFKECYASEKIHGTSAHVSFKHNTQKLTFYSGGSNHDLFVDLFSDKQKLIKDFNSLGYREGIITIYGEAYGGKCQGMSKIYGKKLYFTAFEIKHDKHWFSFEGAARTCLKLGIEFVPWKKIPCTVEAIDAERDSYSWISHLRTGQVDSKREGVVLRSIEEFRNFRGERIISKHKNPEFSERKSKRDTNIDPDVQIVLNNVREIAEEWVTPMRLSHVLDKMNPPAFSMFDARRVIEAMKKDVFTEGEGEFENSKALMKDIGNRTGKLLREYFQNQLKESD